MIGVRGLCGVTRGRGIAELAQGKQPSVDLAPYSLDRFRRHSTVVTVVVLFFKNNLNLAGLNYIPRCTRVALQLSFSAGVGNAASPLELG